MSIFKFFTKRNYECTNLVACRADAAPDSNWAPADESVLFGLTMLERRITRQLAWAAGTDAGNRLMRKAGRTKWSRKDYNAAVTEFNRLWPMEREIDRLQRERAA